MSETNDNGWGGTLAGAGITGALVAALYAGIKILKRSRCASHTGCCDLEVDRAETERRGKMDAVMLQVLEDLRGMKKSPESSEDGDEKIKKNEEKVNYV